VRGPDGNIWFCEYTGQRVRKVAADGKTHTVAGSGQKGHTGDGGPALQAAFNLPHEIRFDKAGDLFICDIGNHVIRKVDMNSARISTFAGTGKAGPTPDGSPIAGTGKKGFTGHGGPAKEATLSGPKGIAVAPNGNVYLADTESHSVRMVDLKKGTLELVCGTGEKGDGPDGDPLKCKLARLHGLWVDRDGSVFIGDSEAHRVRVIRP